MIIEITKEQSRLICFHHIADTLIIMKQYLDNEGIRKYKFMLSEMGDFAEIEEVIIRFDKAWPNDVKWDDI